MPYIWPLFHTCTYFDWSVLPLEKLYLGILPLTISITSCSCRVLANTYKGKKHPLNSIYITPFQEIAPSMFDLQPFPKSKLPLWQGSCHSSLTSCKSTQTQPLVPSHLDFPTASPPQSVLHICLCFDRLRPCCERERESATVCHLNNEHHHSSMARLSLPSRLEIQI